LTVCLAVISQDLDSNCFFEPQVIDWMLSSGIRPNVRTYTAMIAALGRASQWTRAQRLLQDMRRGAPWAGAEPNAYTYSALLKSMGDQAGTLANAFSCSAMWSYNLPSDLIIKLFKHLYCMARVYRVASAQAILLHDEYMRVYS
jgi:pentatricopeptide repeat protein